MTTSSVLENGCTELSSARAWRLIWEGQTFLTEPRTTTGSRTLEISPVTWRGRAVLDEDDLPHIHFPYPPEPDWKDE